MKTLNKLLLSASIVALGAFGMSKYDDGVPRETWYEDGYKITVADIPEGYELSPRYAICVSDTSSFLSSSVDAYDLNKDGFVDDVDRSGLGSKPSVSDNQLNAYLLKYKYGADFTLSVDSVYQHGDHMVGLLQDAESVYGIELMHPYSGNKVYLSESYVDNTPSSRSLPSFIEVVSQETLEKKLKYYGN